MQRHWMGGKLKAVNTKKGTQLEKERQFFRKSRRNNLLHIPTRDPPDQFSTTSPWTPVIQKSPLISSPQVISVPQARKRVKSPSSGTLNQSERASKPLLSSLSNVPLVKSRDTLLIEDFVVQEKKTESKKRKPLEEVSIPRDPRVEKLSSKRRKIQDENKKDDRRSLHFETPELTSNDKKLNEAVELGVPRLKMKRMSAIQEKPVSIMSKRSARNVFHERRIKLICEDHFEPFEEPSFEDCECEVEEQ